MSAASPSTNIYGDDVMLRGVAGAADPAVGVTLRAEGEAEAAAAPALEGPAAPVDATDCAPPCWHNVDVAAEGEAGGAPDLPAAALAGEDTSCLADTPTGRAKQKRYVFGTSCTAMIAGAIVLIIVLAVGLGVAYTQIVPPAPAPPQRFSYAVGFPPMITTSAAAALATAAVLKPLRVDVAAAAARPVSDVSVTSITSANGFVLTSLDPAANARRRAQGLSSASTLATSLNVNLLVANFNAGTASVAQLASSNLSPNFVAALASALGQPVSALNFSSVYLPFDPATATGSATASKTATSSATASKTATASAAASATSTASQSAAPSSTSSTSASSTGSASPVGTGTTTATPNYYVQKDFTELNVLVSRIEVKQGGYTSRIFIDEYQCANLVGTTYQALSVGKLVQTVAIPWGYDYGTSAATQEAGVCTDQTKQCLTIPSSSCADPKAADYDYRLCKLGQLTLSQDRCYVSVGGLNVKQNTPVFTGQGYANNNNQNAFSNSPPLGNGGGSTSSGTGVPNIGGAYQYRATCCSSASATCSATSNPPLCASGYQSNAYAPRSVPAYLDSTFPTSLAMFSATFPTSQRQEGAAGGCSKYWSNLAYTSDEFVNRHPSSTIRSLITSGTLPCQAQPYFQRNQNWCDANDQTCLSGQSSDGASGGGSSAAAWTKLQARTLENIPRAVGYGAGINNDELTYAQRTSAGGVAQAFFYATGDVYSVTGKNSLYAIQYLSSLMSLTNDYTSSIYKSWRTSGTNSLVQNEYIPRISDGTLLATPRYACPSDYNVYSSMYSQQGVYNRQVQTNSNAPVSAALTTRTSPYPTFTVSTGFTASSYTTLVSAGGVTAAALGASSSSQYWSMGGSVVYTNAAGLPPSSTSALSTAQSNLGVGPCTTAAAAYAACPTCSASKFLPCTGSLFPAQPQQCFRRSQWYHGTSSNYGSGPANDLSTTPLSGVTSPATIAYGWASGGGTSMTNPSVLGCTCSDSPSTCPTSASSAWSCPADGTGSNTATGATGIAATSSYLTKYATYISQNYTVPTTFDFRFSADGLQATPIARSEFTATPLDVARTDLGTQGLCFATDQSRPPSYYQHLLTVTPQTYNSIRYWGDHSDYGNTPAFDVAAGVAPTWGTGVNGAGAANSATSQLTMSSSLSLFNLYGESSGVPTSLGNCASYMKTSVVGSNNNAVFWAEYGAAAAVKRGQFSNSLWLTQESIWPYTGATAADTYVLGVALGAEQFFLFAVTPTRLFFTPNPLDLAVQVTWTVMNTLTPSGCTSVRCDSNTFGATYEYRGVAAVPRSDYCIPYTSVTTTASASSSQSPTYSVSPSGSVTSTASVSSRPTVSSKVSPSSSGSLSSSLSATVTVSTSQTATPSASASTVPFSYVYGNVLVSRLQRLGEDNFPCKRTGLVDLPGWWTTASSVTSTAQCDELARVWIDEYSWYGVDTTQYPNASQNYLFTLRQSMHFPHRKSPFPDAYRLTLPFTQTQALGLGQLTQSGDRCSVSIAGFDLPYNFKGQNGNDPYQNAFMTPDVVAQQGAVHPDNSWNGGIYANVTPFNAPGCQGVAGGSGAGCPSFTTVYGSNVNVYGASYAGGDYASGGLGMGSPLGFYGTAASFSTSTGLVTPAVVNRNAAGVGAPLPNAASYYTALPMANCMPKIYSAPSTVSGTTVSYSAPGTFVASGQSSVTGRCSGDPYGPPIQSGNYDFVCTGYYRTYAPYAATTAGAKDSAGYAFTYSARTAAIVQRSTTQPLHSETYPYLCNANAAAGYPISVARIGGRGWKDVANTWYGDYYSHWMPTKSFFGNSDTAKSNSVSGMLDLLEAPEWYTTQPTNGIPSTVDGALVPDSIIGGSNNVIDSMQRGQNDNGLGAGTNGNGKGMKTILAYPAWSDSFTSTSADQFFYRSGEFLARSWDQVPRAAAYTTVQNTANSLHRDQVFLATGQKSASSNVMGGSVVGRCWYGLPGTSTYYSNGQVSTTQPCFENFTITDPGNTAGSTGLCYVGSSATIDLRLLQVRPVPTGAVYSWPQSVSSTSVDQSYTPSLSFNDYLPTTAAGTYASATTFSSGLAYSGVPATKNTVNSLTNGGVAAIDGVGYVNALAASGGATATTTKYTAAAANFSNCAAYTPNTVSVTFSNPSSIFWPLRGATGGYAVQRSDFVVTTGGFFGTPAPIWGGSPNSRVAQSAPTPCTGGASACTTVSRGCAFMQSKYLTPQTAYNPYPGTTAQTACYTGVASVLAEGNIDKDVVGIAYHTEPMQYKSWTGGYLYATTLHALYGSWNPLAPYNPTTLSLYPPSMEQTDPDLYWPFWHKLMQLGVGASLKPFPEFVQVSGTSGVDLNAAIPTSYPDPADAANSISYPPFPCFNPDAATSTQTCYTVPTATSAGSAGPLGTAGGLTTGGVTVSGTFKSAAAASGTGKGTNYVPAYLNVNSISGVAIAPRTCVYDNSKFRE